MKRAEILDAAKVCVCRQWGRTIYKQNDRRTRT